MLNVHQRVTHQDIIQAGLPAQVNEIYDTNDILFTAATEIERQRITIQIPYGIDETQVPHVWLVKNEDAQQAYALTHHPDHAKNLSNPTRPPDWGKLFFAVIYPVIAPNTVSLPIQSPTYVAIKRLNKAAVNLYLQAGGEENPYKEMCRMRDLGDNVHVLDYVELLQDETYIYIITPKACELGTLKDYIKWYKEEEIMDRAICHSIFCKILRILQYLAHHGINHHDISPDNFLFLSNDNLVIYDLALSNLIPINPITGHRTLIMPTNRTGTNAWMDPIVYRISPYDGLAMDLWAAALILYNMLTNDIMYMTPDLNVDVTYRYFIHCRGLGTANEQTIDILNQYMAHADDNADAHNILLRLHKLSTQNFDIEDDAMDLLQNILHEDPNQRFTLEQVFDSEYVNRINH